MREEKIRVLREQALSFFGTITASLSHEISNSLAIIGELSGLLKDLLLGAEQGQPMDDDKLKNLSQRLTNQVTKSQEIIRRLNRFSHSVDDPDATFDLCEVLQHLVSLAQRFAFLKGVRLENASEQESIVLRGSPFSLQQAVFVCIRLALAASKKDDTVTVTVRAENSTAKIITTWTSLPGTEKVDSDVSFLSLLMKELGGDVKIISSASDKNSLVLTFPRPSGGG